MEGIGPEKWQTLLKRFNNLGVKSTQDDYIAGIITATIPIRSRVRNGNRFEVCKKAFCSLHGISRKHVELIAQHLSKPSTITAPQDMRGKHKNKSNAIPLEVTENISKHIKEFPRRKSHYGRSKNLGLFDIGHRHASFPITFPEAENKACDGQFALQKLKYNNVMTLASKYVSEDCMPYYRSLKNNSQNDKGKTDTTDDNSGSED
ncbi:hypothetical protein ILUMI_22569 [Ignelater luminosus]|uniref:Uncharacterized protein n=1 Tax=Ignelater luminosus TaxID=2038154 RepID=A0A8K0G0E8_IGNLU|nr:hypothetical protein ILUMI_22569 [Ignelater luminosus]